MDLQAKNKTQELIAEYINSHPKVLEEFNSGHIFTSNMLKMFQQANTDEETVKHLLEMVFSSLVLYNEVLSGISELTSTEVRNQIFDRIKNKIEEFKDE